MAELDDSLMVFVNAVGVATFLSIVAFHFVTATPNDAKI